MEQYVGIEMALEWSSVCVMNRAGTILHETRVASAPEPLVAFCDFDRFPGTATMSPICAT